MILDYGRGIHQEVELRLANVWAPEMNQPGGPEVQRFISEWFTSRLVAPQWNFVVWSLRMKRADREQMTFNRYVATVHPIYQLHPEDTLESVNAAVMRYIVANNYGPGVTAHA